MKRLCYLFACLLLVSMLLLSLCACQSADQREQVIFDVENYGEIVIALEPDMAPITVANFKKLVGEGFYDGLTFHRIADLDKKGGYIIQGGGQKGNREYSAAETIKGEFKKNGVNNTLLHERGTISMARTDKYDSASSQFFICTAKLPHLDENYAAFGTVIEGMDVIDAIAKVPTLDNDAPKSDIIIRSAKLYSPMPLAARVLLATGGTVLLLIVFVLVQGTLASKMNEALNTSLGGDKRKRKQLEIATTALPAFFYLHAKHLLRPALILCYVLFYVCAVLLGVGLWVLCFVPKLVPLILSAVSLVLAVTSACYVGICAKPLKH